MKKQFTEIAPAQFSLLVQQFLAKNDAVMILQTTIFTRYVPCHLFLCPRLKKDENLEGHCFVTVKMLNKKKS